MKKGVNSDSDEERRKKGTRDGRGDGRDATGLTLRLIKDASFAGRGLLLTAWDIAWKLDWELA